MKLGGRPVYNAVKSALASYCRIPSARRLKRKRRLQQQCIDAATAVSADVDRKLDIDTEFCTPLIQHHSISSDSATTTPSPHPSSPAHHHQVVVDDAFRSAPPSHWCNNHEYYYSFYHLAPPHPLAPTPYAFAPNVQYCVHQQYAHPPGDNHPQALNHHHSLPHWSIHQQQFQHYPEPYSHACPLFTSQPPLQYVHSAPLPQPPPPPPPSSTTAPPWAYPQAHHGPHQSTATPNTNPPWLACHAFIPDSALSNSQVFNSFNDNNNYYNNDTNTLLGTSSNIGDDRTSPFFSSLDTSVTYNSFVTSGAPIVPPPPHSQSAPPPGPLPLFPPYPVNIATSYTGYFPPHFEHSFSRYSPSNEDELRNEIDNNTFERSEADAEGENGDANDERNSDVDLGFNEDFSTSQSLPITNLDSEFSYYSTHGELASFEPTEEMRNENCAICLESLGEGRVSSSARCRHVMHTVCLSSWLRRDAHTACPVCRIPFSHRTETIPRVNTANSSEPSDNVSLDAIDVTLDVDRVIDDHDEEIESSDDEENQNISRRIGTSIHSVSDELSNDVIDDEEEEGEDIEEVVLGDVG